MQVHGLSRLTNLRRLSIEYLYNTQFHNEFRNESVVQAFVNLLAKLDVFAKIQWSGPYGGGVRRFFLCPLGVSSSHTLCNFSIIVMCYPTSIDEEMTKHELIF